MLFDSKFHKMDGQNKRFVRFHNETENHGNKYSKYPFEIENQSSLSGNVKKNSGEGFKGLRSFNRLFSFGATKVHSEGYESKQSKIWDPRNRNLNLWNNVFLCSCLATLFIDPLFYYLPVVNDQVCLETDTRLAIIFTVLRSITDFIYLIHIMVQFRTGYIVHSSGVLGRGNLVVDPVLIAKRYLTRGFVVDIIAVLPLPQIIVWVVLPPLKGTPDSTKNILRLIVLLQLFPRLIPIVVKQWSKPSGLARETAWGGAAYNLLLYMLISHLFGACWYLLAVEREDTCWRLASADTTGFQADYLDCRSLQETGRSNWNSSFVQNLCDPSNNFFQYGIYGDALNNDVVTTKRFLIKYFYCLWWGLRNLSTIGQGLSTSSYVWEVVFSIFIAIIGLTLFARLIGNMQTYLQSLTVRLEEMRLKRHDMEQWMQHRQLPTDLRSRVRSYEHYKWQETRGVKEEELVSSLPKDLRRDIKRHLCINLVKEVPLFASMDDRLLDAICERLQPTLFTPGTDVVCEGDPVNEMLFVIRGHLKSETTNGGRTGFLNVGRLKPGHFCGEELLTWALDPKSGENLPSSTRSVKAETEVEAFALRAEDLKFVATQFRRLHSKQVQHTFRHYSQQWQTWAACSIQAAWRRFKQRKIAELRRREEQQNLQSAVQESHTSVNTSLGTALYASRFAANAMRGVYRLRELQAAEDSLSSLKLRKPSEPDFSVEEGD